ncbi:hypothetical protein B5X24_HaOG206473 [Helicoverpa armigera]|uniref:Uncharacterized protein n=1 Tax=Helicoverpa armigera TaxID=29058 RepID=A0A2W1BNW6_HELAM|nr:hypothetical protein B5X24_HaOG206473 [Helicoverpa armigera]
MAIAGGTADHGGLLLLFKRLISSRGPLVLGCTRVSECLHFGARILTCCARIDRPRRGEAVSAALPSSSAVSAVPCRSRAEPVPSAVLVTEMQLPATSRPQ